MPLPKIYIYVLFRLLIPFIIGIFLGDYLFFESVRLSFSLSIVVPFFLLVSQFVVYWRFRSYARRWFFGLLTYLFFLSFGVCWQNVRLQQTVVAFPEGDCVYRVVITDRPEQKERSVLCGAQIIEQRTSNLVADVIRCDILLYFPLDSTETTIRRGDELLLSAQLSLPQSRGNPDEFDYARFLIHKGISGTGFVNTGKWTIVRHETQKTLKHYASDCRDWVLEFYRELGFRNDNFAVLSALTVGYKEELSESIRESYSVSGASHVLALSGLHIGLFYALLFFLLKRIPGRSVEMNLVRVVVTILVLWAFAFITGFSPSVVRSVIMFSLLAISQLSFERPVSLNTLCVAGMGMLIYNPSWLFDVGFQLSFLAVIAILFIQPWLYRLIPVSNRLCGWLWGIATVSIAAQIGVAPLILFYFSRFSVHFLLTNVLVIPLVTLILYVAVIMLMFFFIPVVGRTIAVGLDILLTLLNRAVSSIEKLPYASVDDVWIYRVEVLLFYLMVLSLSGYIVWKRPRFLMAFLLMVLVEVGYRTYKMETDRPRQSIVFYNVRQCPAVHCILPDGRSWVAYVDSLSDEKILTRTVSNYWRRFRLSSPVSVRSDYADSSFIRRDNFLSFGGKRVCIVDNNQWRNLKSTSPFSVDYLYLCKNYKGRIAELISVFDVNHIVLDASLPSYRVNALQEESADLGISSTVLSSGPFYFKSAF